MHKPTVLIVDDETLVRWSLRQKLEEDGCRVVEAGTGAEAMEKFVEGVDAVLLDFNLPDTDGIEVLGRMRAHDQVPPIIMLTAHSSVERAVLAMKSGAMHFAEKPFDLVTISSLVQRALEPYRLRQDVAKLLTGGNDPTAGLVIGESPSMKRVRDMVRRVARSPGSTVLITGESGTGKDVAARAIHTGSARATKPFMNITCSALTETLLESELFGHERGAFTDAKHKKIGLLEQADGGTVFLDEIAEMTPSLQAKLLRFLEEKAFRRVGGNVDVRPDVRIIAATHKDLQQAIEQGAFRADLYYRLAVLHLAVPPLRERTGDIPLLAKHFIERFSKEFHKSIRGVAPAALEILERHSWPGNVRELRNSIERSVLLGEGPLLEAADFEFSAQAAPPDQFRLPPNGVNLDDLEKDLLIQALERTRGNQSRAAKLLGLSRDQIRYRMAKFNLNTAAEQPAAHTG
jgi:two-component system response regulator AtoC